jgi:diguanylate cyclase (GGDEF)-like protein/PAS domain S-box-containing protein
MTNILPHQIVLIIGTIISLIVLMVGWPRRKLLGGVCFIAFCFSVTEWLIASTVESFVTIQSTKVLWSQISYFGFTLANPFLLLFLLTYIRQREVTPRMTITVLIIPFLTIIVAWTNSFTGWLWPGFSQGSIENNVLIYHHGFWFWLHTAYLYLIFIGMVIYLIRAIVIAPPPIRRQLLIILIGVMFPLISGTVYAFGWVPIEGLDITPTGLAFTGAFLAWALIRYQLLDLLPVARTALIEQLQDGVIVLDMSARIADINRATQKLLGWDPKEMIGKNISLSFPELPKLVYSTSHPIRREIPLPDSPGVVLEFQSSSIFNQRKDEVGKLLVIRDVTSRNRAEADLQNANRQLKEQLARNKVLQKKLEQQALHDSLTGLYNRHIDEILHKEFSRALREKKPISLAMVDIDHFKSINDKLGHQYGDLLLKSFSQYILSSIREEDLAIRFGGDEILLVFPGMSQEDAVKKAEEIRLNFMNLDVVINQQQVTTTITVGVATFPQNGKAVDELIRSADWALYAAKEEGRNRVKAMNWSE